MNNVTLLDVTSLSSSLLFSLLLDLHLCLPSFTLLYLFSPLLFSPISLCPPLFCLLLLISVLSSSSSSLSFTSHFSLLTFFLSPCFSSLFSFHSSPCLLTSSPCFLSSHLLVYPLSSLSLSVSAVLYLPLPSLHLFLSCVHLSRKESYFLSSL